MFKNISIFFNLPNAMAVNVNDDTNMPAPICRLNNGQRKYGNSHTVSSIVVAVIGNDEVAMNWTGG